MTMIISVLLYVLLLLTAKLEHMVDQRAQPIDASKLT